MARDKKNQSNIDNSNPSLYPNARIRDNDGSGNGTPVNEQVYGDIHEFFGKVMRDSKTDFNNLPDNVNNNYQYYDALMSLGGKNDLLENASRLDVNTLSVPIKLNALKINETLEFRAIEDSLSSYNLIKGSDNVTKTLNVLGAYKAGQYIKIVNLSNSISVVGLYNTQNAPNIIQRLADIEAAFVNYEKIMSVFQANGAMVFWNKPANLIPTGWAEVINWRGRFPVGFDASQTEFQNLGDLGVGGAKKVGLTVNQLPLVVGNFETIGGGSANPTGVFSQTYNNQAYILGSQTNYQHRGIKLQFGNNELHDNLPPYKTVLFIEYIG